MIKSHAQTRLSAIAKPVRNKVVSANDSTVDEKVKTIWKKQMALLDIEVKSIERDDEDLVIITGERSISAEKLAKAKLDAWIEIHKDNLAIVIPGIFE